MVIKKNYSNIELLANKYLENNIYDSINSKQNKTNSLVEVYLMHKILHIFPKSRYLFYFIDFISKNFESSEHRIVAIGNRKDITLQEFDYDNIVFLNDRYSLGSFLKLKSLMKNSEKVIIHNLKDPRVMLLIIILSFLKKGFCSKLYWYIWGTDLYFINKKASSLKQLIIKKLRIKSIRKIDNVITGSIYPYKMLTKWFKVNPSYYNAFYPDILISEKNEVKLDLKKTSKKIVLLGNSATRSNKHFNVLEKLYQFKKGRNFIILCPLVYGEKEYRKRVIDYGKKLFGKAFVPLIKPLEPHDYLKVLSKVDVAIMNHNRQQAFGTIRLLLALGKKVYIRRNVYMFKFLTSLGVEIFDTNEFLSGNDNNLFMVNREHSKKNISIIKDYFSGENCVSKWNKIFNS